MASNPSKIFVYKKSSLSIASRDYRSVVKDVKRRQLVIQAKLDDTLNLKTQLSKLAKDMQASKDEVQGRSDKEVPEEPVSRQPRKIQHSVAPANTQERSIIRRPGGTKRKGMFSGVYGNVEVLKRHSQWHCKTMRIFDYCQYLIFKCINTYQSAFLDKLV